jgi:UDP-N-acetylmuramoyl-L-alanyl-D-glutamate--2,6-diaminopimelate ligase
MSTLKDILYKVAIEAVQGSTDVAVNKMNFDSRKIESNDVLWLSVVLLVMVMTL